VFEYGVSGSDDGTGFGLAIVTAIADAHDWRVSVGESRSGGARFEVAFGGPSRQSR
jgi:signal transduction histidine kinase